MSNNQIPRPFKFKSVEQFVYGNSGDFGQSYRSRSPPKSGVILAKHQESLYDRYNVNNLLLKKVNKNHIQILNKNLVLKQEDVYSTQMLSQTASKHQNKNFSQTVKQQNLGSKPNNFFQTNVTAIGYDQSSPITEKKPVPKTSQGFYSLNQRASKQYTENQLLFNFNKIAEQKKVRKKQFLQTMQAKLNQIQQQAKQLEQCQLQEQIELERIQRNQNDMGKQLSCSAFLGRMNAKVVQNLHEIDAQQFQQIAKPKSLDINMGTVQINHVLSAHYDENQKLLDEVTRVKVKSRQKLSFYNNTSQSNQSPPKTKQFEKTGDSTKGFNKTSISKTNKNTLAAQNHIKYISTTIKHPPRQGRR